MLRRMLARLLLLWMRPLVHFLSTVSANIATTSPAGPESRGTRAREEVTFRSINVLPHKPCSSLPKDTTYQHRMASNHKGELPTIETIGDVMSGGEAVEDGGAYGRELAQMDLNMLVVAHLMEESNANHASRLG